MSNLGSVLQRYTDKVEPKYPEIPGIIGIVLGGSKTVEVPNRGQFLYVRLRANTSEFVTAYNDKVFPGYDLPVIVQWKHGRYEIVRRDSERYTDWETENPYLPKHGAVHSMNVDGGKLGSDPVWVYPYNFMPALVSPFFDNNALNVYINPQYINFRGTWRYIGNTGTPSLSTYSPVSGSCIVLVTIDGDSGNPALFVSSGTYIPSSVTGSVELTQYVPTFDTYRYLPLSFIVIQSGTTRINWGNLHDVRQFVGNIVGSTGTAGSGGGTPGGSDTHIQYNISGTFGGTADFTRNSDGSISIGGASAVPNTAYGVFQRADGVSVTNILASFGTSVASFLTGIRARGTYLAQSAVLLGDVLFRIRARGHDGVGIASTSAEIRLLTSEDYTSVSHGTNIEFYATPTGTTSINKVITILGNGNVNLVTGQYQIGGSQHTHSIGDIIGTVGSQFQRNLTANLSMADGESLVVSGYVNQNSHDIILAGDATLHLIG